ncbi:MAG: RNA-dependent DNA polymerase [Candidatus Riflebacteria bacterium]|nr:RNA-dependent DNA polymerase [Candidatus Riflebacteria bacterium]
MKSYGGLWNQICSCENLTLAMFRAARAKKSCGPVNRFLENSEIELKKLKNDLDSGSYKPAPFVQFKIRDPKPRLISCADFRDRVVHHALCAIIGPVFERSFIDDTFACRVGKGSHKAVLRSQQFSRRNTYFAKLDIRKYFDSIDQEVLLKLLFDKFREKPLRNLFEIIVKNPLSGQAPGKGIPIGNLTSQWFANFYLSETDHVVQEKFRVGAYIRYMDDFAVFENDKERLWKVVSDFTDWLKINRHLEVKWERFLLAPCSNGLPFLGWRIFPGALRLQHGRYHRARRLIRRRMREFEQAAISGDKLSECVRAVFAGIHCLKPQMKILNHQDFSNEICL